VTACKPHHCARQFADNECAAARDPLRALESSERCETTSKVGKSVTLHSTARYDTTGMDSMRHDLRAALDDVPPETIQPSADAAKIRSPAHLDFCRKCSSPPTPGGKLRYCGRCAAVTYCSKQCAREHWAEHKPVCASMRTICDKALAAHVAQGGRTQDFNQARRDVWADVASWFEAVPGLLNEIELLAWAHRGESPFIHVSSSDQSDAGGRAVIVEMIPRSFWDEDPRFVETYSEMSRECLLRIFDAFDATSFCLTEQFVCVMTIRKLQVRGDLRMRLQRRMHSWRRNRRGLDNSDKG
jgi:hypothetical protein